MCGEGVNYTLLQALWSIQGYPGVQASTLPPARVEANSCKALISLPKNTGLRGQGNPKSLQPLRSQAHQGEPRDNTPKEELNVESQIDIIWDTGAN